LLEADGQNHPLEEEIEEKKEKGLGFSSVPQTLNPKP
jgi:hypothetical protein